MNSTEFINYKLSKYRYLLNNNKKSSIYSQKVQYYSDLLIGGNNKPKLGMKEKIFGKSAKTLQIEADEAARLQKVKDDEEKKKDDKQKEDNKNTEKKQQKLDEELKEIKEMKTYYMNSYKEYINDIQSYLNIIHDHIKSSETWKIWIQSAVSLSGTDVKSHKDYEDAYTEAHEAYEDFSKHFIKHNHLDKINDYVRNNKDSCYNITSLEILNNYHYVKTLIENVNDINEHIEKYHKDAATINKEDFDKFYKRIPASKIFKCEDENCNKVYDKTCAKI